jgi:RNA polymerase sigma factor (sigma-70 family)
MKECDKLNQSSNEANMDKHEWLAEQFEGYRNHLKSVAYRMLGSLSEADDAVQASWLNLTRSDTSGVENLGGWLTTVVARVCLDMLRSRKARREEALDSDAPEPRSSEPGTDPEHEALLADSVGLALLVVLNTLNPDERLAFVLHDIFAMPFTEIAPIVGRTPTTTRQLASRARRRVRGVPAVPDTELTRQREVVEAFLTAARAGDFEALLTTLDPDIVFRADAAAMPSGAAWETSGARAVAKLFMRPGSARGAQPALVNGAVGVVVAPHGRLMLVLNLTMKDGKIVEIEAASDPARLNQIELAAFND